MFHEAVDHARGHCRSHAQRPAFLAICLPNPLRHLHPLGSADLAPSFALCAEMMAWTSTGGAGLAN